MKRATSKSGGALEFTAPLSRRGLLAGIAAAPVLPLAECPQRVGNDGAAGLRERARTGGRGAPERFVEQFVGGYNRRDIPLMLRSVARDAVWTVNRQLVLEGRSQIREFIVEYGAEPGAGPNANGRMVNEVSFLAGDAVLFEGRLLVGVHGELAGFPAVDRSAQVAYAFFCWFDDRGRCTSAEVFLDWGALVLPSGQ